MLNNPSSKIICISGNIAAGKTTIANRLHQNDHWTIIPEPLHENPFLSMFYDDMPRWAFHSQIFFLIERSSQYVHSLHTQGMLIQDRTIYEDAEIFARNLYNMENLSDDEYRCYLNLYTLLLEFLRPPDIVLYLYADTKNIMERIKKRGRPYEQSIKAEYIDRLNDLYGAWFKRFERCPIIKIDTSNTGIEEISHEVKNQIDQYVMG